MLKAIKKEVGYKFVQRGVKEDGDKVSFTRESSLKWKVQYS
jgi:hypothetical protein